MRIRRVDTNQKQIVKQLRKCGYSVAITSMLGKGFPDVVVGAKKRNFLFEIKDENKPPSEKRLTPDEQEFFDRWRGQINKVENIDEIIEIIEKYKQ